MKNILLSSALLALCLSATANAASINNGSLTGALANFGVPTGWGILAPSPDTNNEVNAANAGNIYDVNATVSSNGGTWVGIARDGSSFIEGFGQTVSGLTIGSQYKLSWENAHFGALNLYNQNNQVEALINGASIGSGSLLSLGSNWFFESLVFTAMNSSIDLSFQLALDSKAYLQIDGISLTSVSSVPVPGAVWLMGSGLLGLMGFRRKDKKLAA